MLETEITRIMLESGITRETEITQIMLESEITRETEILILC